MHPSTSLYSISSPLCKHTLDLPPPNAPVPAYILLQWSPFNVHICLYISSNLEIICGLLHNPRHSNCFGKIYNNIKVY